MSVRVALLEGEHLDEARTPSKERSAELLTRAASLQAPELRESFLGKVRENARLLAIARDLDVA